MTFVPGIHLHAEVLLHLGIGVYVLLASLPKTNKKFVLVQNPLFPFLEYQLQLTIMLWVAITCMAYSVHSDAVTVADPELLQVDYKRGSRK